MKLWMQYVFFFCVFFLGAMGINYFSLSTGISFFGDVSFLVKFFLSLLLTLSFPFSMLLEKKMPNPITRSFYILSTLWIGSLAIFFPLAVLFWLVSPLLSLPSWIVGTAYLGLSLSIILYSVLNSSKVSVKKVSFALEGLKKDLRLVQLSDIHMGTIRNSAFLKKVVRMTNDLSPDGVLITGDLIDGSAPLLPHLCENLKGLESPAFFVSGNHDFYEGIEKVYALVSETGVRILRDEAVEFKGVSLVGVEYALGSDHLRAALENIKIRKEIPSILLHHVPHSIPIAQKNGISLMLCGHTHNGQVFPFNLLAKIFFPYVGGKYSYKGMFVYVSPGTGTWGPYMRLGSRNEITLLELKGA